jgi:hypothetical protein
MLGTPVRQSRSSVFLLSFYGLIPHFGWLFFFCKSQKNVGKINDTSTIHYYNTEMDIFSRGINKYIANTHNIVYFPVNRSAKNASA